MILLQAATSDSLIWLIVTYIHSLLFDLWHRLLFSSLLSAVSTHDY